MTEITRIASQIEHELLKHMILRDLPDLSTKYIEEHGKEFINENTVGVCYMPISWNIVDTPLSSKLEVGGLLVRFTMSSGGAVLHEPVDRVVIERELPRAIPITTPPN